MALCWVFSITASQAAAQARGRTGQQSAAASSISGMSLQEAQQILNIPTLSPEELQKVDARVSSLQKICSCGVTGSFYDDVSPGKLILPVLL